MVPPKKVPTKKKAAAAEAPKPAPDAAAATGDAKKDEAAGAAPTAPPEEEKKKPVRVKKPPPPMMPIYEPIPAPTNLTVSEALQNATGWSNSNNISKKFSVGTTTTAGYNEKCRVFQDMNTLAEEKSSILPMSNFQTKHKINPDKDRFDRRVVK